MFDSLVAFVVLANLGCAIVSYRKGRKVLFWFGIVGIFPALAWVGVPAWIGAAQRARQGSEWAVSKYGDSGAPSTGTPPPSGGQPVQKPPEPAAGDTTTVLRFLEAAAAARVVDAEAIARLRDFLVRRGVAAPEPVEPAVESAPSPAVVSPPPAGPTPPAREIAVSLVPTASAQPPPKPVPPTPPPAPSAFSLFLSRTWEAVASDVALHGLSYLGVVLTFVGVLGFLLFAFTDVPEAMQPVVELIIAFIFFGWSWMLRRQDADRVASGMEVLGGMVVPLIVFASLVDPFPPQLTGSSVVVGLPVASLVLAALYAWVSKRNDRSTLRYLVWPLVWLAAMTAGFAFKTDEPLVRDAITRLVSPQPALAAAAIGLTVIGFSYRREQRLAGPTIRSALVGLPFAYLLTVSLSMGEGWTLTWPVVLLGVSTLVAAEGLLSRWFERTEWMAVARPFLVAGVLLPLAPSLGAEWVGLAAVAIYIVLLEYGERSGVRASLPRALAMAGVGLGLAASIGETIPMLVSFAIGSVWAHIRRGDDQHAERNLALTTAAALLPIGVAAGIDSLMSTDAAALVMASIVLAATGLARVLDREDLFFSYWALAANAAVAALAVFTWVSFGSSGYLAPAAVLVVAIALSVAARWPIGRFWLASAALSGAIAMFLDTAAIDLDTRQIIWAALGVGAVIAGLYLRKDPLGQLPAVGHFLSGGVLASLSFGGSTPLVLGAWTLGWVVAAVGDARGMNTVTGVLGRALSTDKESGAARSVDWLVPVVAVASAPFAALAIAGLWPAFVEHRSWTGVLLSTIGALFALGGVNSSRSGPLRRSLEWGAVVTSIIGVAIAPPDPWPTIYAATALIGVAVLLSRELGQAWLSWLAWLMTVVIATLLAGQVGVAAGSLHLVTLVWGGAMLMGGLVVDDRRSGRRQIGEGLRTPWLRFPVVLGALVVPVSLGPAFIAEPKTLGWWAVGAALAYGAVAILTRVGPVTAPAYALGALGIALLLPWSVESDPWMLVLFAAPLVAASRLAELRQSDESRGWLRWDLAPLVVAVGIGGISLVFAVAGDVLAPAAVAFGLLAMVIGIGRHRAWVEIGNLMVLLAAWDSGVGWLALALAATSARGLVGTWMAPGESKHSYRAISVLGAGLAWPAFLAWSGVPEPQQAAYSMLVFGGLALAVGGLARWWSASRETVLWWGSLSIAGLAITAYLTIGPGGPGIAGPWSAIGWAMTGLGVDISWRRLGHEVRFVSIFAGTASWVSLASGLSWEAAFASWVTAIVFGVVAVGIVEFVRMSSTSVAENPALLGLVRAWGAFGVAGVMIAGLLAASSARLPEAGYGIAIGLVAVAIAAIRGAEPLRLAGLRDASVVALFAAALVAAVAAAMSVESIVVMTLSIAALATLGALFTWRRAPSSLWVRPGIILATAANAVVLLMAINDSTTALWIGVLLSLGVQAIAAGLVLRLTGVLALGPPLLGGAAALVIAQSVEGVAQWVTALFGLVLLAEVEVFRLMPVRDGEWPDKKVLVVFEWAGVLLIAAPPLVEMFTDSLFSGLIALLVGVLAFVWGVATRMRRRVVGAASLVVATVVLFLFAAAAGGAPKSAFFWIVSIGIGFAVMLVAGLVEAYRSKKGRAMTRFHELMEGWE